MNAYQWLQIASGSGFIVLIIMTMTMDSEVKTWLPPFIWAFAISCLVTFFVAIYMQPYAFALCIITLCVFSVTGAAVAVHGFIKPRAQTVKQQLRRKILYFALPTIAGLVTVSGLGIVFKGSLGILERVDKKTTVSVTNQGTLLDRLKRLEARLDTSEAKREKAVGSINKDLRYIGDKVRGIETEQESQSIRTHKNTTEIQKLKGSGIR